MIAASPSCEICGATDDLTADHVIPSLTTAPTDRYRRSAAPCNSLLGDKPLVSN
jgi:hypothetical protein